MNHTATKTTNNKATPSSSRAKITTNQLIRMSSTHVHSATDNASNG